MRPFALAICFLPFSLFAQHCGYDFASVIVVRPHAAGDSAVIEGLRITLLDSNNLPLMHQGHAWDLFRPNSDYEACAHWQGGFMAGYQVCFPFAKDNYVLVIPTGYDTSKMKVLVQDERPRSHVDVRRRIWPERYTQKVVPLTAFDSYRLCGVYDEEVYPHTEGRPNFAPVDVILRLQ
ncbi:MAG: hypothetical protein IPN85_03060 [Flavobacteriales bacterium]|nr:hypothetical protein [Flavobacteriales bacterium]MBL0034183.1 hypothetical protein [Flavobacteriales bacterium]